MDTPSDPRVAEIHNLLEHRANASYGLHGITQREHALQTAMFAEVARCRGPKPRRFAPSRTGAKPYSCAATTKPPKSVISTPWKSRTSFLMW